MVGTPLGYLGYLLLYFGPAFVLGMLIGVPCHFWRRFHPRLGDTERGDLITTTLWAGLLTSTCYGVLWAIPELLHHPNQTAALIANFPFVYGTLPAAAIGAAIAGLLVRRFVPRAEPTIPLR